MKTKTTIIYRITRFLLLAAALFIIHIQAQASGNHEPDIVINNYYDTPAPDGVDTQDVGDVNNLSITNIHDGDALDRAVAMSAAGDTCIFDYAPGWQGCVGAGFYESTQALNGSLAMRLDQIMLRTNIQTDTEFEDLVIGVGGSWHF